MESIEKKIIRINNKKKDLPEKLLKQGLGSLFISVNSIYEKVQSGLKKIELLENFDDLHTKKGDVVVVFDIRDVNYDARLDNIAYAKRNNENLCVIVKDVLIEEYQMYLYNMYNIDGVIFDVKNVYEKDMKGIMNLASIMGIETIASLTSKDDLLRIGNYFDMIRLVVINNVNLLKYMPKDVYIIKDEGTVINDKNVDIIIEHKNE